MSTKVVKKETVTLSAKKAKKVPKKNISVTTSSPNQAIVWKVPECVKHYFSALVDPFESPAGACMPCDLFPLPSQKVKVFIRGKLNLGTSGIGFILANPTLANDVNVITRTTSTSVITQSTQFTAATNIVGATFSQLPYNSAALTAKSVQGRVLALGVRIKYIGSLMNRNGLVLSLEDPDHQSTVNQTFDSVSANPYADARRVGDGEWDAAVCWSGPVTPQELEYANVNSYADYSMVMAISGAAGDLYEFEVYEHAEFIGTNVPGKTPSHSAAEAFGKMNATLKASTSDNGPIKPEQKASLWEQFTKAMSESLPGIMQVGRGLYTSLSTESPAGLPDIVRGVYAIATSGSHLQPAQLGTQVNGPPVRNALPWK